jgi:outer membrane protein assembly complex protein YaeT
MKATAGLLTPHVRSAAALAAMLLWGALVWAQSQAGKVIVDDVIPQGNRQVPTQKIIGLIRTRPGGEYLQETINEDVRKLYETRLFANVRVQTQRTPDDKVKVYFIVTEYPSAIQEIIYNGAKHLKPEELETTTGLHKGAPLNPIANQMARQAILHRYNDDGRLFAGVDLVEGGQPGDTRVVFNITEGPKVKINHIDFTGNTFVSEARLRTQIDSSSQFLGIFGGTLEMGRIDHDVAKLEEYYKSFGYQDVRVSRELQWEPDFRHVRVIYHVQEGQRYRVTGVQVDGNKIFSSDQLLERSKLRAGDFYNKNLAEADHRTIENLYGYRGYRATVQEQEFVTGPGLEAVHYEVQERPPARVGQIRIVGNTTTKDAVVLRQVPLRPGQILSYPDIRQAEVNLARLQIFETNPEKGIRPTVTIIDPDIDSEFKDILVNVQEMPTGSLIFGVGVNSDAGLTGSIALNERNFDICRWPTSFDDLLSGHAFRGAGQEFRAEAVPGTQIQRYTVSFREPYLFDSDFGFNASAYYYNRIYNEYTESRLGTRFGLSRRLNQYWSVSSTLRLEDVGVHNVPLYEPEQIQVDVGQHFLAGIRTSVTRDTRDSYLRATEGTLIEASFEQFLGDYTFPQFTAEANQYWTIYQRPDNSGRHVLAARAEVGFTGSHTPVFERFYAGGFRSLRGFEFRGVGPAINGFEIGGEFELLTSLEYQVPILANDHLYGVVFVDSGTVESTVEIRDYRVAAGAGLRIVVPMLGPVPIALDLGFPIVKAPQDREQVFSFWVGFFH